MATTYLTTTAGAANWSSASSWSLLAVPVNGDAVTIANSAADITSGLGHGAVTLASLAVPLTFTGTCGTTVQSVRSASITRSGSTATATVAAHGYASGDAVTISGAAQSEYNGTFAISNVTTNTFDYSVSGTPATPATGSPLAHRSDYLCIGVTSFTYGDPGNGTSAAAGSGRFKINFGATQVAATVLGTRSTGADASLEPLRILGTHASNTLAVLGGLVGIATTTPDETATFATLNLVAGTLNAGAGLTWTTVNQVDGTLRLKSGGTTFTQSGGTATLDGAGTITTATVGGTLKLNLRKATAGDTVTTLHLTDGAELDLTGNPAAISIGTLQVSGSVKIRRNLASPGHLSWTTLTQDAGSTISFE